METSHPKQQSFRQKIGATNLLESLRELSHGNITVHVKIRAILVKTTHEF